MRRAAIWSGACLLALTPASYGQGYHVADHWTLGGQGGWDYLLSDDAAHRLYVTHGTRVEVIDTGTGKSAGAITGLKGTHGVALNPDGKSGYVSDGGGNSIVVFDRSSLAVTKTVAAGANPDGIAFEPVTKTVWAFNGRSKDASVMDATTNSIVATIPLPGKPEFPQADGTGKVFVNIEDKNLVVELDARAKKVVRTWPLTGCDSPSGMAIDRVHHRLFSVCDGKRMIVSDYAAGHTVGSAQIGDSPDAAAFDSGSGLAFSSNGEGTLTVVDTGKPGFPVAQTISTAKGARTMAYDPLTGRAFLSAAKFGPAPAPTAAMPHPRPAVLPGSFEIIMVSR